MLGRQSSTNIYFLRARREKMDAQNAAEVMTTPVYLICFFGPPSFAINMEWIIAITPTTRNAGKNT